MVNPSIQLYFPPPYPSLSILPEGSVFSLHTTVTPRSARRCSSLGRLASSFAERGQPGKHPPRPRDGGVKDATPPSHDSQCIQSSDRRRTWWMMRLLECLRSDPVSASRDNSIHAHNTLCFGHIALTFWAPRFLFFIPPFLRLIQSEGGYRLLPLFANRVTFCPSRGRAAAYSTRLRSEDLQLEDNRCLICAVMWDEGKADGGTVMNLYERSCPALTQSQAARNHGTPSFCLTSSVGHRQTPQWPCLSLEICFFSSYFVYKIHQICWRPNMLRFD